MTLSKDGLIIGWRIKMRTNQAKRGTQTSSFGTPGRINHDSTKFYESRLYDGLRNGKKVKYIENEIPEKNINKISVNPVRKWMSCLIIVFI